MKMKKDETSDRVEEVGLCSSTVRAKRVASLAGASEFKTEKKRSTARKMDIPLLTSDL
jgi:hypothetical protein